MTDLVDESHLMHNLHFLTWTGNALLQAEVQTQTNS